MWHFELYLKAAHCFGTSLKRTRKFRIYLLWWVKLKDLVQLINLNLNQFTIQNIQLYTNFKNTKNRSYSNYKFNILLSIPNNYIRWFSPHLCNIKAKVHRLMHGPLRQRNLLNLLVPVIGERAPIRRIPIIYNT